MILKKDMRKFLVDFIDGIGEKTADELTRVFGDDLEDVLDEVPEELLKIKGINKKKLEKIVESWKKFSASGERSLTKFFASYDISVSSSLISKISLHFNKKREDVVKAIQKDPFVLLDIEGIGFSTADYIYLKLGGEPLDTLRMRHFIQHLLSNVAEESGHTYLDYSEVYSADRDYIVSTKKIEELARSGRFSYSETDFINAMEVVINENSDVYYKDHNRIALMKYYDEESFIRNNVEKRIVSGYSKEITKAEIDKFIKEEEKKLSEEKGTKITLDKKQKEAIYEVAKSTSNIFLLCGYAGTGKTTLAEAILDFLQEYRSKRRITTCALSGMASRRIHALTGYPSSTIHSLLGFNPQTGGFRHNANNLLENDVVLVDEASMINLYIFYSLLKSIQEDAFVILVGDDAQLPPIGEGNVFSDLLNKPAVPKTTLEKIYRQKKESVIPEFGEYIRKGKVPPRYLSKYEDFEFVQENSIYNAKSVLLKEIGKVIEKEKLSGFDKILKIQVISPQKTSEAGTNELNKILQERLNDSTESFMVNDSGDKIKIHDKVIHIKNADMPTVSCDDFWYAVDKKALSNLAFEDKRIFNGNMGIIQRIDKTNEVFYVEYSDIFDKPIMVCYRFDQFKEFVDLGYAVTVHKSQGSQFDYVFMPVFNRFYYMLNNKLLYTAITRAKKKVTIIGETSAFERACTSIDRTKRNTFLSEFTIDIAHRAKKDRP